jgi:hypothetical protein
MQYYTLQLCHSIHCIQTTATILRPPIRLRRFPFSLLNSEPHSELNAPLVVLLNNKTRVRW